MPAMAVTNHPVTTTITPVMRYTALSRPQALSASDEPIDTIKMTYVVDSGSFSDVPRHIRLAAAARALFCLRSRQDRIYC